MSSPIRRLNCFFFITIVIFGSITACAQRPYLEVNYQNIAASNQLDGKQVRIQVKDLRTNPAIFTPEAASEFQGFQDQYRLFVISEASQKVSFGDQDLTGLVYQVFSLRLKKMGAEVVAFDRDDVPLLQVLIKNLKIDLRDSRWVTSVSFEGNLSVENRLVARETVSGEAERIKILGNKGADDTFSGIFSEIINRLNIVKLFSASP